MDGASANDSVAVVCDDNEKTLKHGPLKLNDGYYGKFNLYLKFMACFGLFHWRGCCGMKLSTLQKSTVWYAGFVLLVMFLYMGKCMYVIFCCREFFLDNRLVLQILMFSWILIVFWNCLIMFDACWCKKGGLHHILAAIESYIEKCDVPDDEKHRKIPIKVFVLLISSCVWVVFNLILTWVQYFQHESLGIAVTIINWPFVNNTKTGSYLQFGENVLSIFVNGSFIGTAGLFLVLCVTIAAEFKKLTSHISAKRKTDIIKAEDIQQYQIQYQCLSKIVAKLDHVFRGYLAGNICIAFCIICFGGYQLLTDKDNVAHVDVWAILIWICIYIVIILKLSLASAELYSMVSFYYCFAYNKINHDISHKN